MIAVIIGSVVSLLLLWALLAGLLCNVRQAWPAIVAALRSAAYPTVRAIIPANAGTQGPTLDTWGSRLRIFVAATWPPRAAAA